MDVHEAQHSAEQLFVVVNTLFVVNTLSARKAEALLGIVRGLEHLQATSTGGAGDVRIRRGHLPLASPQDLCFKHKRKRART